MHVAIQQKSESLKGGAQANQAKQECNLHRSYVEAKQAIGVMDLLLERGVLSLPQLEHVGEVERSLNDAERKVQRLDKANNQWTLWLAGWVFELRQSPNHDTSNLYYMACYELDKALNPVTAAYLSKKGYSFVPFQTSESVDPIAKEGSAPWYRMISPDGSEHIVVALGI